MPKNQLVAYKEAGSRVDLIHTPKALAHVWRDMDRSELVLPIVGFAMDALLSRPASWPTSRGSSAP